MIQIIKCYRYITYIYIEIYIYIWYRYRYRYRHRYRYRYAHCHLPLADWNSGFSMAMFEFEYQRLCLGFNSIHHWTTGTPWLEHRAGNSKNLATLLMPRPYSPGHQATINVFSEVWVIWSLKMWWLNTESDQKLWAQRQMLLTKLGAHGYTRIAKDHDSVSKVQYRSATHGLQLKRTSFP